MLLPVASASPLDFAKYVSRPRQRLINVISKSGLFVALLIGLSGTAVSNDKFAVCRDILNKDDRLHCYDKIDREPPTLSANGQSLKLSEKLDKVALTKNSSSESSGLLSKHWEVGASNKHGTWNFRPHKPNYFLFGRYTDSVNYQPYDPYFRSVKNKDIGLDNTESKFQLSFKLKALEDLWGSGIDLWFGYTQQNHWQVYNKGISAPFRETNYEPEAFLAIPTDYNVWGLRGRFVNLGFVHQSNGQSNLLSRSWNRIYAQAGFELGDNFGLTIKPWYRLPEKASEDDNPKITEYLGNFETIASYRLNKHTFSLLARSTFDFQRGFAQLDWSYPLQDKLKGYIQFTSGYGESLIDYNHRQNTFGIGILLSDWM